MKHGVILLCFCVFALATQAQSGNNLLQELMQQKPAQFGSILAHPNDYRVQIIYTQRN